MKKIILPILLLLMIAFLQFNRSHAQSGNLVLWNKLGTQDEVENSAVGPGGEIVGGSFISGVFGNAYVADYNENELLSFPTVLFPYPAGAIEFWAKLIGFPSTTGWGGEHPGFILAAAIPSVGYPVLRFVGNDGHGGGGLSATIHGLNTATGGYRYWTYAEILGADQVGDWHHYAVVWNVAGIPDVSGQKIAIYLNGQLNSGRWGPYNPNENDPGMLLIRNTLNQGSVAIDNIKVWDYAKTDFSDRFIEGPYFCVGFEPPMDEYPVTVKGKNTVLPLKAELFNDNGLPIRDTEIASAPVIQVLYNSGTGGEPTDVTDQALPAGQGTEGNQFVFTDEGKWQYNLKTKNYVAPGTYTIFVVSGDKSEYFVDPACETSFVRE